MQEEDANQVSGDVAAGQLDDGVAFQSEGVFDGARDAARDDLECLERGGIMAAGLFVEHLLDAPGDEACDEAVAQHCFRETALAFAEARTAGENHLPGFIDEVFARDDVVDHAAFERGLRGEGLADENDVERPGHADEPRQSRRAAPGGEDAELRFGQADLGGLVGRSNAGVAGQADFVTAADARAMNRGDGRYRQGAEPVEEGLAEFDEIAEVLGAGELGDRAEVRARDENSGLGAGEHDALEVRARGDEIEMPS